VGQRRSFADCFLGAMGLFHFTARRVRGQDFQKGEGPIHFMS